MANFEDLHEIDARIIRTLQPLYGEQKERSAGEIAELIDDEKRSYISQRLSKLTDEKEILKREKNGVKRIYSLEDGLEDISHDLIEIQKTKDFTENVEIDQVSTKGFYSTNWAESEDTIGLLGTPVELNLQEMKVPVEKIEEDNSIENILQLVLKELTESSDEKLKDHFRSVYNIKAEATFSEEELEDVLDEKDNLVELMWENTDYSFGGVRAEYEKGMSQVSITADSFSEAYSSMLDSEIPTEDQDKFLDFLDELEDKLREIKKLMLVLRNF